MSRDRQQADAVAALLEHGADVAKAAAAIGVRPRTLATWLGDPQFAGTYRAALAAQYDAALQRLQVLAFEATNVLREIMRGQGDGKLAMSRMAAARHSLELSHKLISSRDLARRLEALEKRIEDRERAVRGGSRGGGWNSKIA